MGYEGEKRPERKLEPVSVIGMLSSREPAAGNSSIDLQLESCSNEPRVLHKCVA